jgi:hypothetical protein
MTCNKNSTTPSVATVAGMMDVAFRELKILLDSSEEFTLTFRIHSLQNGLVEGAVLDVMIELVARHFDNENETQRHHADAQDGIVYPHRLVILLAIVHRLIV